MRSVLNCGLYRAHKAKRGGQTASCTEPQMNGRITISPPTLLRGDIKHWSVEMFSRGEVAKLLQRMCDRGLNGRVKYAAIFCLHRNQKSSITSTVKSFIFDGPNWVHSSGRNFVDIGWLAEFVLKRYKVRANYYYKERFKTSISWKGSLYVEIKCSFESTQVLLLTHQDVIQMWHNYRR